MKKLILTFVLLLTVSFAFATNGLEKTSIVEIEKTIEITHFIEITESISLVEVALDLEVIATRCCTASDGSGTTVYVVVEMNVHELVQCLI